MKWLSNLLSRLSEPRAGASLPNHTLTIALQVCVGRGMIYDRFYDVVPLVAFTRIGPSCLHISNKQSDSSSARA